MSTHPELLSLILNWFNMSILLLLYYMLVYVLPIMLSY